MPFEDLRIVVTESSLTVSVLPVEGVVVFDGFVDEAWIIGIVTLTTVPRPTVDVIEISPFRRLSMDLTRDSPRPVPIAR